MNIPSIEKCFDLIKQMEMMSHIIDHSIMVANVAFFLSQKLKPKFPELNIELVTNAALLHDITKTRSFDTKEQHAETGGELLTQLGYSETGDIIRQHVILDTYNMNTAIAEQEIVNYSDKRVLHDNVVLLEKRLAYIKSKYGNQKGFKERIKSVWADTRNLEKKIFSYLDIDPEQLSQHIEKKIKK
jgi:putative nucleotidyltransferase with HDIG domain